jgi:heme/copper-type cytochrome/quinol oxidase subunit 3
MELYLKKLSGFVFYTLGLTFFGMYLAKSMGKFGVLPTWWFEVFDLPLAISALVYAGTSVHLSLRSKDNKAVLSGILITLVLISIFVVLFALNYWVPLGMQKIFA